MSEFKTVNSKFFIFIYFIFNFGKLRVRVNIMLLLYYHKLSHDMTRCHILVTWQCQSHSHTIICHIEEHKRFWKDNYQDQRIWTWFFLHFLSHFIFFSSYFSFFSIFRTLGLGLEVIGHTVILVTLNGVVTTLVTGLKRRK